MRDNETRGWGPAIIRPEGRVLVLGRSSTATVLLRHPSISRRHAELRPLQDHLMVCDLGSRSGTRINGRQVKEQVLKEGDRVEFGPIAYEYRGLHLRLIEDPQGIHLQAHQMSVVRGGQRLLSDIDLNILPNQFVGILGSSGSGKSTLIKCLAGYLQPASGKLSFDDLELPANQESYRRVVGYVPQEDVVYAALTGWENLDFSLRLRISDDLQPQERTQVIESILARLRLTDHASKPVAKLSGGQRKRLNVAVELLSSPRILLLDEPTSGLDPAAETRLMHLLKDLAARGTTVVCSTHVMENLSLFDQVVVVADETVVYQGQPGTLLPHFNVSGFARMYEELDNRSIHRTGLKSACLPEPSSSVASGSILRGVPLVKALSPQSTGSDDPIKIAQQLGIQFLRGLRLIWRDKILRLLLIGQPVLIALLINLSQLRPNGLGPIFLFAVVTSIWLGLNNTAREVLRDRSIYVRERLVGVTPEGYLGAKVLLYGLVGLSQIIVMVWLIKYANRLSQGDAQELASWSMVYQVSVLWCTYLSAMILGLVVSTWANTQEVAVAALPLIILPQLLLTGVATGLDSGRDGSFRSLLILFSMAGEASRGFMGWLQELVSLLTYSRPALALLQKALPDDKLPSAFLVAFVDWMHLLFLLLASATALVISFRRRERQWLEG